MARIVTIPADIWRNEHRTLSRTPGDRVAIDGSGSSGLPPEQYFAATADCLKAWLSTLLPGSGPILTLGTAWSFRTNLLDSTGPILETHRDRAVFDVSDDMLAEGATIAASNLILCSGGAKIRDLNVHLEAGDTPRSIYTSGSFNGQSIGGMLGTGVHGSLLGHGPFHNDIRGIHLITGTSTSVWLERGPDALFDPGFVQTFADHAYHDADVFDAAVVHLGGMGIVNAVALEVRDGVLFDVVKFRRRLDRHHVGLLERGDFAGFARALGHERPPCFIELTLDPFAPYATVGGDGARACITFYFEAEHRVQPSKAGLDTSPADSLDLIAKLSTTDMVDPVDLIPPRAFVTAFGAFFELDALLNPPQGAQRWGTIHGDWSPRRLGPIQVDMHNDAYAIPRERLGDALAAIARVFAGGGAPLVATIRFVSRSVGHLAFTRFDECAVINLDGLRAISSTQAGLATMQAFDAADIPFSQHWGKMGEISAKRFASEFGDPLGPPGPASRWRAARATLLDAAAQQMFSNSAIAAWELA